MDVGALGITSGRNAALAARTPLFWSGQSFTTPGLRAEGKFKAAGIDYAHPDEVDGDAVRAWLGEARTVQWDYANIVKRRGVLERLR